MKRLRGETLVVSFLSLPLTLSDKNFPPLEFTAAVGQKKQMAIEIALSKEF